MNKGYDGMQGARPERRVRGGVFTRHASRERSQGAVPAQVTPWGEIRGTVGPGARDGRERRFAWVGDLPIEDSTVPLRYFVSTRRDRVCEEPVLQGRRGPPGASDVGSEGGVRPVGSLVRGRPHRARRDGSPPRQREFLTPPAAAGSSTVSPGVGSSACNPGWSGG